MRNARDNLVKATHLDTRTVHCGLMVGTAAFHEITVAAVKKSFDRTGLWTMDYRFQNRFSWNEGKSLQKRLESGGVASRISSVLLRHTDRDTFQKVKSIFEREAAPCIALREVECVLQGCKTVNRVLMETVKPKAAARKRNEATRGKDLSGGTPAIYLTVDDLIRQRKEKESAAAVAHETKTGELEEKKKERLRKKLQREEEKRQKRIAFEARKKERKALENVKLVSANERKRKRGGPATARKVARQCLKDRATLSTGSRASVDGEIGVVGALLSLRTEKLTLTNKPFL